MTNRAPDSQLPPFVPALILFGSFVLVLALLMPEPAPSPHVFGVQTATPMTIALVPTALPPTAVPQTVGYSPAVVSEGQGIFQSVCSTCHGLDARGIPGLGKNLIESQFVHGLTDEELLHFITTGRDTADPLNTTGIPMPPRGANPSLTDDQLRSVIAFIRTQSGSPQSAQAVPTTVPAGAQVAAVVTPGAPLFTPILPTSIPVTPQPFSAQTAYTWSCAGCHGADGKGNLPFAEGFDANVLLADRAGLLAFLIDGRPLADPRIEFPHPPRGGYPALTDEQLSALTDYVLGIAGN